MTKSNEQEMQKRLKNKKRFVTPRREIVDGDCHAKGVWCQHPLNSSRRACLLGKVDYRKGETDKSGRGRQTDASRKWINARSQCLSSLLLPFLEFSMNKWTVTRRYGLKHGQTFL